MNDDDLAPTLRDLLSDETTWVDPPPDGADRLLAAIRAEGRVDAPAEPVSPGDEVPLGADLPPGGEPGLGAPPSPIGTTAPSTPGTALPGEREPSAPVVPLASRRRGRVLRVLAAAAAVVVVAGAAGILGAVLGSQDDGGHDGREVAIGGGDLAPEASATAYVEELGSGVAIELDVRNLPPAPPGAYYEAWLRNEEVLVPIGTFHMREGDEIVELWAGVDLDDYPTLTVTLQQEGAGQDSSGQLVLRGDLA